MSQSGFWAKALPEEFANEGNIIAFWVDKKGRVFYRINDSAAMLFFNGVRTADPLWALVDVYGLTRGVQLLGECPRPAPASWGLMRHGDPSPRAQWARGQHRGPPWPREATHPSGPQLGRGRLGVFLPLRLCL